ncbi:Hypothetical predicted protein [Olea europaea subsp. europaea]|uniref:Small acidic protein-like domain-containing protein n=1 Tax=Olea europaea subsp. europaea TaxID=158383 RepID=A0A8S0VBP5_OLEEU|nr:Hypothetical predicted protein [Olea europaea subsp. europaea]
MMITANEISMWMTMIEIILNHPLALVRTHVVIINPIAQGGIMSIGLQTTLADNESSSFKQAQEASGKIPSDQAYVTDFDIDAAKIAAMKAAELANKNLVGTGYMSTDQKKKLLWGNKKKTTEESVHHWDTTTFGDRERQEKFNKLMGVKGDTKVEQKLGNQNVEKQREQLQLDLEKQYTAGLRRRDGRTVGLGL